MKAIKNILKGMVIGIANIIPGVSGGTMMVAMGIYDKLIHCITHIFKEFKKSLLFLIPIAIGMGIAIIGSSFGIEMLFEIISWYMCALFSHNKIDLLLFTTLIPRSSRFLAR